MSVVVVQTREDKCRRIGQENVDGVLLGRTPTTALMSPTPSLVEEEPTNKSPAQRIGLGIVKASTVT